MGWCPHRARHRAGPGRGCQRAGFHIDQDLALLSAPGCGRGNAGQAFELRLDDVIGQVVELPLVERVARHVDVYDRNVRYVELKNIWLRDAGRQGVEDLRHALLHFKLRVVQVGVVAEPGADDRCALLRGALDPLDTGAAATARSMGTVIAFSMASGLAPV